MKRLELWLQPVLVDSHFLKPSLYISTNTQSFNITQSKFLHCTYVWDSQIIFLLSHCIFDETSINSKKLNRIFFITTKNKHLHWTKKPSQNTTQSNHISCLVQAVILEEACLGHRIQIITPPEAGYLETSQLLQLIRDLDLDNQIPLVGKGDGSILEIHHR